MARKDVFHQLDCLIVRLLPQSFSKEQFGSQEEADRPHPLLKEQQELMKVFQGNVHVYRDLHIHILGLDDS